MLLKLVNNSSCLNKGNHDSDSVWIYLILIGPLQLGSRDQNSPKNIICYGL